jgi:hypothetical protein
MAMPTGEHPSYAERAAAKKRPVTTDRNRPLARIGGLAHAMQGWLSGKPISERDRVKSAVVYGQHNWARYW